MAERQYVAIDLKSFYASVECVERGLDPLRTCLVVADESRTEKTICLAVTPALKSFGVAGRARLFEVVERVREVNALRQQRAPHHTLSGKSSNLTALERDSMLALDYIVARPRMRYYMKYSTRIYELYTRFVAPEDIQVYSIDEVFMDVTDYLRGESARDFAVRVVRAVLEATGITATVGIGTNLYLCKIAMDIVAKHMPPDRDGVRIAELDEMSYRRTLWAHRPLTDFWRVGRGYAQKLEEAGLYTMGDIARCSLGRENEFYNEGLLYKMFGVAAELLIDHAWGWEPCTIPEIKAYKPESSSLSSGQVLSVPYDFAGGKMIVREMVDRLVLDLVEKGLMTDQLTLTVGYDVENLRDPVRAAAYKGEIKADRYGRAAPKHAHGTANLEGYSSSTREIGEAMAALYERITDKTLLVRRLTVTANRLLTEAEAETLTEAEAEQFDLFSDPEEQERRRAAAKAERERERRRQKAVLAIQQRYGRNALLKGTDLQEGATAMERNGQVGGHRG